ncbi:unnamed protein product [Sphagnum tenellum]
MLLLTSQLHKLRQRIRQACQDPRSSSWSHPPLQTPKLAAAADDVSHANIRGLVAPADAELLQSWTGDCDRFKSTVVHPREIGQGQGGERAKAAATVEGAGKVLCIRGIINPIRHAKQIKMKMLQPRQLRDCSQFDTRHFSCMDDQGIEKEASPADFFRAGSRLRSRKRRLTRAEPAWDWQNDRFGSDGKISAGRSRRAEMRMGSDERATFFDGKKRFGDLKSVQFVGAPLFITGHMCCRSQKL